MLPLKNTIKKLCGGRRCGVEVRAKKKKSALLFAPNVLVDSAPPSKAQSVEQQRRHGCKSVSESHVSGGPLGLAAGSTKMLPPL